MRFQTARVVPKPLRTRTAIRIDRATVELQHRGSVLYELLSEVADACAPEPKKIVPLQRSLEDLVLARLREYASNLKGHSARDMYGLIMPQLERPLVRVAMELAHGCQQSAAKMLGIHRNTLRTKLKELGLSQPDAAAQQQQQQQPKRRLISSR